MPPAPEARNRSDDPVNGDVDLSRLEWVPDTADEEWRTEMEAAEMIVQGTPAAIEFIRCIHQVLGLPLDIFALRQPIKLWPYLDDCSRLDGYCFVCDRRIKGLLC